MPFYCGNDFLGEHSQFIDRRIHIIGSDRSTYFRGNCHVLAGLLYRDYCGSMMATQIGKPLNCGRGLLGEIGLKNAITRQPLFLPKIFTHTTSIASPKLKKRYFSFTASSYAASTCSLPASALTSIMSVDSGKWKLVISPSNTLNR